MAITITKQKQAEQKAAESLVPEQEEKTLEQMSEEELADLYGSLDDQLNALKMNPVFAKFDAVSKELSKRLAEQIEPLDSGSISGKHWELDIGVAASNPRKIKDGAISTIQTMLGAAAFAKLAKVGIGDLEKYLTPEQLESVLVSDPGYSTKRKISVKFLG